MGQLSTDQRLGVVPGVLALLTGLAGAALGVGLLGPADSAFGAVWASRFLVFGLIVWISCGAVLVSSSRTGPLAREVTREGEPARFLARRGGLTHAASMAVLSMLGGWFLVMGGVGGIEENWFWPVLAACPTFYFLGFSVLAALGRLRLGGCG